MDNLGELSTLWQNYQPDEKSSERIDLKETGILKKLQKLEKKQFRINIAKTIGVILCLVFFSYTFRNLENIAILSKIAFAWIIFSLLVGFIIYWKMQYNSAQLNFIDNNQEFIKNTILKLKSQQQIITHLLPAMVFSLILGINAIYFDLLQGEDITIRITLHLIVTAFCIAAMMFGLSVRKKRFNNDFKPLIEELESIKKNFKSHEK